jgi:hypothetical protein
MKRLISGLLLGVLAGSLSANQQQGYSVGSFTGAMWQQMDGATRLAYIAGYVDAQGMYGEGLRRCGDISPVALAYVEDFQKRIPPVNREAAEEVIQGINKLASDFRNKRVNLVCLVNVVSMELAGRPAREVDETLRRCKSVATQ